MTRRILERPEDGDCRGQTDRLEGEELEVQEECDPILTHHTPHGRELLFFILFLVQMKC